MLLGADTNSEGWAHYCEQMMLDEGFGQPGTGAKDAHEARLDPAGAVARCAAAGFAVHRGD